MTRERGSPAESKNWEILLLPTADGRFDPKVKCPTGWASFWVKFPTVRSLTELKMPGDCPGRGWAVLELTGTLLSVNKGNISRTYLISLYTRRRKKNQQPSEIQLHYEVLPTNLLKYRASDGLEHLISQHPLWRLKVVLPPPRAKRNKVSPRNVAFVD